ncbi:outer membrane protein assembly factor BamA [Helicobacter anatolicus]|uniref:outer membrane protein assembly factor BamA n=1 Tax=Helicobacter anatolicus TaxID=2905874 RepID=UPI001E4B454C|nr:outer membrane protein assembly factor BamA [Helicobacter anatolicus]MCE3038833.1 outer membrane protein assembly factor BamA [Helicobacter anatolicus]
MGYCYADDKILEVQYDGLVYMSDLLAQEVTGIQKGDVLSKEKVNQAVLELYNQGYFKDIYATFDKGILVFHFVEKPRVASVEIKGYGTEQEREGLYKQISIKKGDVFDDQKLDQAKEILQTILEVQGYYGTTIQLIKTEISAGVYAITFDVNRGDTIYITHAFYDGRNKLPIRDLESLSANKKKQFLGFLWGRNDGKLRLQELEFDGMRIQDVYMRHGFLDAKVSSPFLSTNFSNSSASLYYKIDEGKQYSVSDIDIKIDNEVESIAKLKKISRVKIGKIFNIEDLRADAQLLKQAIADHGYAYAVVSPDLDKNEEEGKVKVVYHIQVGQKVKIGDVIITGNTRTADRIIRREILLGPGETYSLTKIISSENALRRLGFFESVKIDQKRINEGSMDLVVNVSEGRTGELQFGMGYGSYGGLMINGTVSERNLFGTGQSGSVYANISTGSGLSYYGIKNAGKSFSGNISLTNPRLFDSYYSASFNLYATYSVNYNYVQQNGGFGITIGKLLTNTLRASIGYDLNILKTSNFTSPLYERYYASKNRVVGSLDTIAGPFFVRGLWEKDYSLPITSSITPSLSFDNTDDYYFPKNGFIASGYAQFNGIGGHVYNTKLYAKFAAYYHLKNLTGIDLIARYKAQGGYFFRYSEEGFLPINNTFYLGGVSTVRGFRSGSISPKDEFGLWVGGDGLFTNSVELSYGLLEAAKMRISAYFDYGLLSYRVYPNGDRDLANFKNFGILGKGESVTTWRAAVGVALEWVSPMGPIVLVFPIKTFNRQPGDLTSSFEFTLGTRF